MNRCMWSRMFAVGLVVTICVHATAMAVAAGPEAPTMTMPPATTPPVIDGTIDEAEWRHAVRSVGLAGSQPRSLASRAAVFWIGCDRNRLYLAVKSEVAPDNRLLARAVPHETRDVMPVLLDDAIEIRLSPGNDAPGSAHRVYAMAFNARGALYDWKEIPAATASGRHLEWRLRDWQMKQQVVDGWWHVEVAMPWEAFEAGPPGKEAPLGLSITRLWQRPEERSSWPQPASEAGAQSPLARIHMDPAAPVVRVLGLEEGGKPRLRVSILNPRQETLSIDTELSDAWHRDPPRTVRERIDLDAGQEVTVSLEGRDGGPEGLHDSSIRVADAAGQRVFYARAFRWSMHPSGDRWTVGEEQRSRVSLDFKYYPYPSKIRFRASVEGLDIRDRITGAEASIWVDGGDGKPAGKPLWTTMVALDDYDAEEIHAIPVLKDGRYVFGLALEGGGGVPASPITRPFARRVFPWEHNKLGISDEVMPPLEPLRVQERTVRAVLREHQHGHAGLWNQVVSQGKELLAGPMRWEVASRGKPLAVETPSKRDAWSVIEKKPTEVAGRCRWQAGPVKAEVTTRQEYDGMMLVTLNLEPAGEAPIDRLSLTVPLHDQRARYMHAVADGLRHNYAGFTPEGDGRIWDSSQARRRELTGPFFPYLWVGDGERGICWFADSDRDWVLDDGTPSLELIRQGPVLLMRVHFITRPGVLKRPHKIVFGLQATPTKPMPDGWRRWVASKHVEGGRTVRWLGSNPYWGALYYDVYPLRYRFDFFDKLAETRRTGKIDHEYLDRWMTFLEKEIGPLDEDREEFFLRHAKAGFWAAKTTPWGDNGGRLFAYTNPRGVGFHVPEFTTFQDEWLRFGWYNRNWGKDTAVGYDVCPSPSFQDYALWYYRKMLTCFDGVYWDNLYLHANFDPVTGGAWVDQQGRVHPSLGLLHMRELVKRTSIMLWRETKDLPPQRKPPITLAHMTNTMLVPVCSFLNCTMDWEWKYGYDDFQDRFSADLTVAETIGRQVGAWPTILGGGHPDAKDPRVDFMWRTRLGVALVHELQVFDYQPERDIAIYRGLHDFGYGTPACRVFNYWHEGHPVKLEGVDARSLAMTNGKRAIIVVTDYGQGGTCRMTLELDRLGLRAEAVGQDFETRQPVQRDGPGVFLFSIKKHDFRIIEVK